MLPHSLTPAQPYGLPPPRPCAKINGQLLGWDPFEAEVSGPVAEVEIILTRRNTFGPLHDTVKNRPWNGPDHWVTEGPECTTECILTPAGLLAPPQVSV